MDRELTREERRQVAIADHATVMDGVAALLTNLTDEDLDDALDALEATIVEKDRALVEAVPTLAATIEARKS